MAVDASHQRSQVRTYLEMIKIEHSIFALPFAMIGMMYAADGFPGWRVFLLIVLCMVSARSAAMAFNRIADAKIDALNPRTASRAIPAGALARRNAILFFAISCAIFFAGAALLNRLTLVLAPAALGVMLIYSLTKRFTWLCHFVLGLSLGIAPAAAWIAVTGEFAWTPAFWILAVMFWTAGFDILYALQDDEFDLVNSLHSIPSRFGRRAAIRVSRALHALAAAALVAAGYTVGAGPLYYCGCAFAAGLLIYEQSLVNENDLSRIDMAFFTLNGWVSIGFFGFGLLDVMAA
jgi:4-hydroxybenzoate polyprenyltransferase